MHILKQMLHEKMETLMVIDNHFLRHKDCIRLIGEYIGMKREWLVFDKPDWYKNRTLEILCPFMGCKAPKAQFGKHYGYPGLFLSWDKFNRVFAMQRNGMHHLELLQSQNRQSLPNTNNLNNISRDIFFVHICFL